MSWSVIASTSKLSTNNTSVTTDAIDTSGVNLLVVCLFWEFVDTNKDGSGNFSDSKGNTWQPLTEYKESGSSITTRIRYCINPTVGTNHTFTFDGGGDSIFPALGVTAWSGTSPLFFDDENGATAAGTTTLQTGSVSKDTGRSNGLYIAAGNSNSAGTSLSIDSSFTVLFDDVSTSTSDGAHVAYKLTSNASENPTWTSDPVSRMRAAAIAVFTETNATDETIWQLGAMTAPTSDDLLVAVDDPGGTPATKKLALSNLMSTLLVTNVVLQVKTVGSGTYTPTSGMKKVLGIAVGGGGGGGGGINTDSSGGGGGGGGTVIRLMTAAQVGASKAYVVGAGGSATNSGTATTLDAAGALMNAGGGSPGSAGAGTTTVGVTTAGGAGGTASNGDLNIPGEPGGRGWIFDTTNGFGGPGGSSFMGFGGAASGTNTAGNAGTEYGGGGGGGHASGTPNRDGASGADGILYLLEFID